MLRSLILDFEKAVKEKDVILTRIRQELRDADRERIASESELKDVRNEYENFKLAKKKEINQKGNEFEFKNNEFEIMKTAYEKLVEENFCNEVKVVEERTKYSNLYAEYKEKMAKYEEVLEELSK